MGKPSPGHINRHHTILKQSGIHTVSELSDIVKAQLRRQQHFAIAVSQPDILAQAEFLRAAICAFLLT
jgi:hypothetical protein